MSNLSNLDPRHTNTTTNTVNYQHLFPYSTNVYQQNTVYPFNHYAMQIPQHPSLSPYQQMMSSAAPLLSNPFLTQPTNGINNTNKQKPDEQNNRYINEYPQPLPLPNSTSSKRISTTVTTLSKLKIFLKTQDIIQWPLSNELMTIYEKQNDNWHKKFSKLNTTIKGIYRIGKHLWLGTKGTSEYHKIKAITYNQWVAWIPRQNPKYIKSWKRYTSVKSAEHGFDKIGFKSSNGNYHLLKNILSKYHQERLIQFIIAIKTLYQHKGPKKECWKCGEIGYHTAKECQSAHKNTVSVSKFCRYGVKCNRNICPFKHKHQIKCRYGGQCRDTNCEYMHSVTKKRKADHTVQDHMEERPFKKRRIDEHLHSPKTIKDEKETVNEGIMITDIRVSNIRTESAEKVILNCANCDADLRNKDLWRCSKCKTVYYCGKQCQSIDWKRHKLQCGKSREVGIKMERVSVKEWTCYAIIYWLNRINEGRFIDIKYIDLKKHLIIGKIKGCDLLSINAVVLRMMGIYDDDEQEIILNAILDVVNNDDFNNVFANIMNLNYIPHEYLDPLLYELMEEPVRVKSSGYIYDKSFITKHMAENKSDPMTGTSIDLKDIKKCEELKKAIVNWTNKYVSVT